MVLITGGEIATWARIEARTYEQALDLLERLADVPSAVVQDGERHWSIYISADAAEFPLVVYGTGVDPKEVSLIDLPDGLAPAGDAARRTESSRVE